MFCFAISFSKKLRVLQVFAKTPYHWMHNLHAIRGQVDVEASILLHDNLNRCCRWCCLTYSQAFCSTNYIKWSSLLNSPSWFSVFASNPKCCLPFSNLRHSPEIFQSQIGFYYLTTAYYIPVFSFQVPLGCFPLLKIGTSGTSTILPIRNFTLTRWQLDNCLPFRSQRVAECKPEQRWS